MNNLYKSFRLIALMAAVIGLVACQQTIKDEDVFAINEEIANKTLEGIYTFIDVDSAAVTTTLYEWTLTKDSTNARVGTYRVASTGNGANSSTEQELVWEEAKMASDGLSMSIPVTVNGETKTLIWHDGVITIDGYTTSKDLISKISVLRSVHENFANLDFVLDDTTYYVTSRMDTMYYLAWKTAVVSYTQEQIDSAKQAMLTYADTLAWFNATYPSRAVPDTVRFATKPQSDGTYKGQVSIPYEDMEIQEIKTNHGPLHIINSEMIFNRDANGATTGSYVFYEKTWTEECYTKPTSDKAIYTDYTNTVTDAQWTPVAYTNIKKFNIMLKGTWDVKTIVTVAGGEPKVEMDLHEENTCYELPLSGFNKTEGEVTSNELKYKTK